MSQEKDEENLVILVDMDGVIVNFTEGWLKEWNKENPDRPIPPDVVWSHFYAEDSFRHLGIATNEEFEALTHKVGLFRDLNPMPGAIEALNQMVECGLDIFICTAPLTTTECFSEKAEWVEHYLGKKWLRKLVITKDKTLVSAHYLIDDKPGISGLYEDPVWEQVVYDQPYNQHVTGKHRITWATWPTLLIHDANNRRT
jgi:5'-nucleotidase